MKDLAKGELRFGYDEYSIDFLGQRQLHLTSLFLELRCHDATPRYM